MGYKKCVPICPSCNATIHTGAVEQCPVCGYSLKRAKAVFGSRPLEFTRVVDEAGALTHSERRLLMEALEDMERNIPPVALGIFITSHGQMKDFRPHAHWALNQAVIHHPSFGKREQFRAIEDADLAMGTPRSSEEKLLAEPGRLSLWWQKTRKAIRDTIHPYAPPVRQEWMLVLALDVQLETACFTWGYMLDPYVNPDSINSCIIGARLYFRERAMAVGLRKVMKAAVSQLASRSHGVNRRMRKPLLLRSAAVLFAGSAAISSLGAAAPPVMQDDEAAEEVVEEQVVPPPSKPTEETSVPQTEGNAASLSKAPRWSAEDYRHLLSGEISGGYRMLSDQGASPPAPGAGVRKSGTDKKIPKRYYRDYSTANSDSLIDPQGLLDTPQRADVEYALRVVDSRSRYHLYIVLFREEQEIPLELSAGTLARSLAQPGEYVVVLMYGVGDSPHIELGYHEINLADSDRHAWLERVRRAALVRGGGVEGILAAVHELHTCLAPVAEQLPPLEQRSDLQVPLIPIEMRQEDEAEEVTLGDEFRQAMNNPAVRSVLLTLGGVVGLTFLTLGIMWLRRRSGRLIRSEADVRLSSPYGAGVSRNVNYLEGREDKKKTDLF